MGGRLKEVMPVSDEKNICGQIFGRAEKLSGNQAGCSHLPEWLSVNVKQMDIQEWYANIRLP